MIVLQPKRWQSSEHPRYDEIRFKPWFWRIEKRKKVLSSMAGCYGVWKNNYEFTQEELCDSWNVSPREFRDYCKLLLGDGPVESKTFQSILDSAYLLYCASLAEKPIQKYIETFAPHYGLKARPVWEAWETNPNFWPTGYLKQHPR
jgi:hypothetical protein